MTLERPDHLVGRNFLALGSAEAVARIIAFGGTIYLARTLGVQAYGVIALASAVLLYLTHIGEFGLDAIGIRDVAGDRRRIDSVAPSLLAARLVLAVALVLLVIPLSLTFLPPAEGTVLGVYALSLLPIALGTRWIHLGLETARPAALARLARDGTLLVLILILVREGDDLVRVPLANFIGECIASLILLVWLARRGARFPLQLEWAKVSAVARRAWPIVGHALLGLLIYNSDLIFLRLFRDLQSVGYYAAGYTLVSFLLNLGVAYSHTTLATVSRLGARNPTGQAVYGTAVAQVFAVSLPIALGGALVARDVIAVVFGPDYGPAGSALAILVWSVPFSLVRNVTQDTLIACDRENRVLHLTGGAAGINIVLNLLLVPPYGIQGAAAATLATEIVRFLVAARYLAAEGLRPLPGWRLWRPAVAGLAMVGALLVLEPGRLLVVIGTGAAVYLIALTVLGGVVFPKGKGPVLNV